MKTIVIMALLCVNVAMLAALLLGTSSPIAHAQVIGGGTDYTMVSGNSNAGYDVVYILDLNKRRLMGWRIDPTSHLLRPITGRDLRVDFRRTK